MTKLQLCKITSQIIHAINPHEEYSGVQSLSHFFSHIRRMPEELLPEDTKEKPVSGGIALSPEDAAKCLEDYIRTARFIRGNFYAIKELLTRYPGERLQILYAGCGPLATLLLPLLPLFGEDQLEVTLLDMNDYSITSVKSLLTELQLEGYVSSIICADASAYKHPEGKTWHMIVSETMFYALTREPQVTISTSLAPQLHPNGLLVPEEITISMRFGFLSEERYFSEGQQPSDIVDSEKKERLAVSPVFKLNRNTPPKSGDFFSFTSDWFPIPESYQQCPDICLLTSVRVFGDILIAPGESLITNPCCVHSLYNLSGYSQFRLYYSCKEIPSWVIEKPGQ